MIPPFVRKRSKDIRTNRNSKAAGFIGSSNDSLDQESSDQGMDNKNIYNQQAAIRYQMHDASMVAPEASSALQCILSPQMSKRLAHIAPPMPLYKMQHRRNHSISDSDAGPNFSQLGSAQEMYQQQQQQQPLYLPHHPSMYACQHDLAPSQAYYCPSASSQAVYPGGHGYHHAFMQQQQLMQHPPPQRPLSAYTETTSFYTHQHQYPPPYPPPSIPYSMVPPPPSQSLYSSGPLIYPRQPPQAPPQVYSQQELASIRQVQAQYSPYAAEASAAQHSPRRFSMVPAPVQHRSSDGFTFHSQIALDLYNNDQKREAQQQQQMQNFQTKNNTAFSMALKASNESEIVGQISTSQKTLPAPSGEPQISFNALTCSPNNFDGKNVELEDQNKIECNLFENQDSDQLSSESPRHLASGGNRYHCGAKMELEHGRTPLFGQCPVWWGENGKEPEEIDALSPTTPSPRQATSHSSTSEEKVKTEVSSKAGNSPRLRRENIRMDIPFNAPYDKEVEKIDKRRSGPGALAFTIDFTSSDTALKKRNSTGKADHNKAETQWKLQSAERLKQNFLRRSIRKGSTETDHDVTKSILPNKVKASVPTFSAMKESKKLLIDKMFNNYTSSHDSPKIAKASKNIAPVVLPVDEKSTRVVASHRKESCADNESDAGTFVIERDQEEMKARMKIDKVFGISESYASWSSSEESLDDQNLCKTDAVIKPRSRPTKQSSAAAVVVKSSAPRLTVPLTPRKKSPSSEVGTNTSQDLPSFRKTTTAAAAATVFDIGSSDECSSKKGLIKELAKINKSSTQQQATAPILNKATTPRASKKFVTPPPLSVKPSGRSTSFGRNEAGRYSLRAWPSPTNSNTAVNLTGSSSAAPQRQKFVHAPPSTSVSTAKKVASPNAPQKSTELNLWLRRKEYNPMKAAAMGRTQKPSKIEEPPYLSNRSQSFHTGAAALSKLSIKRHQSIENKIDDITGDQEGGNLEIGSDSITCKYTIKFSNDPPPSIPTKSRNADKHSTNSMLNISKLTAELGTHAEQLLNKLNLDQEESNNSNRSGLLSSNSSTATLGQQSSQLEDLVRRLELANRAFEVVDQYLKDQSEKGTNNANSIEPSDPVSSPSRNEVHVAEDSKHDFGVRRISKTKL